MSKVTTLRFGTVDVPDEKLITMERPILGFENLTSFCLVDVPQLAPFLWLQSTEDPSAAFLVVNPCVFYPSYHIEINPKEIAELRVALPQSIETYVIVTLAEDPSQTSVNLQGPILVNTENNLAKQLVLVNSQYQVRHFLTDVLDSTPARPRRERLVEV
ncbi:MAG: flagellar assembly protein FliW [Candidatus Zixiibacteriota bacterium]